MKIAFLNVKSSRRECINKDFMSGYGWAFNAGNSMRARLINFVKKQGESLPLMSFGYMSALFQTYGHEVEYLTNKVPNSDIAFISSSMVDYRNEIEWAKKVKAAGVKVYFIGVFASFKSELFLPYCNAVIKGEPEEICARIADGYQPEGLVESNPISDPDSLVFPNWDIFPHKKFSYLPVLKEKPFFPILSSRGCVYSCEYCPYPVFYKYQNRSVKNVIGEIEYLVEKYNMRGMLFRDPLFSGNKKRAKQIAENIIEKNLKIKWACETRLDCLNEDLLDTFYEAGCRVINVGIESSDTQILDNVNRKLINPDCQKKMVDYAHKLGIRITAFYVLGLEGETIQTINKTIEYSKWLDTFVAQFFINTPFPGTVDYERNKDNLIESDWEKFDCYTPVVNNRNITPQQLLNLKEKAFISYYYRPKYAWKFVNRFFS